MDSARFGTLGNTWKPLSLNEYWDLLEALHWRCNACMEVANITGWRT